MNLKELMEQRQVAAAKAKACIDEMQDLTRAGQPFGEGEQTRFARLEAGAKSAQEELERIDQAVRQHVKDTPNALEGPQGAQFNINTRTDPYDLGDLPQREELRLADLNSRAASVVESSPLYGEDDHRESATVVLERTGGHAAEQIMLSSHEKYRSAYLKCMAGREWDLERDEREIMARVDQIASGFWHDDQHRAVSLTNVTAKLVPAQLDPSVVLTNVGASDPIRTLARVEPVTTNVWTGVSSDGITFGWSGVDDQVDVGDDSPTFSNPAVTCHMWDAFVPLTFAAYEDWFNHQDSLVVLIADARDNGLAQSFVTGSGTNQPYGIVTALSGTSRQYVHATNSVFTYADLKGTKNALGRRYRQRAAWVMEDQYRDRVREFGTNQGALYTVPLSADSPPLILGKPAFDASGFSGTLSNATNNCAVYGDWSNYLIAERVGMMTEVVQNLFSTSSGRPTARRGILAHGRVGADSINNAGFVLSVNPGATG